MSGFLITDRGLELVQLATSGLPVQYLTLVSVPLTVIASLIEGEPAGARAAGLVAAGAVEVGAALGDLPPLSNKTIVVRRGEALSRCGDPTQWHIFYKCPPHWIRHPIYNRASGDGRELRLDDLRIMLIDDRP